jgi:predicted  nucleic acid-binding Zn-ribbon protein
MSKGTLTTLDFIICVLREHEKELTQFGNKLEEIVKHVSGESLKKNIKQIEFDLGELRERMMAMDKKIPVSNGSDTEVLLRQLLSKLSIQNQNVNLLIEEARDHAISKEIDELKASVSSLNACIKELMSRRDFKDRDTPNSGI